MPLHLAPGSTLRKLSASHSCDSSPGKTAAERTRKKTNANEITDEEWIEVKGRLANVRERLMPVNVQWETNEIEEIMESAIMQCEKAMQTGKREDLSKYLQTKLDEEKRDRQDKALAKETSPPKVA